jgi:hypothetical protein
MIQKTHILEENKSVKEIQKRGKPLMEMKIEVINKRIS